MKKIIAAMLVALMLLPCTGRGSVKAENYINNASLMPEYVPDDMVEVDENGTPEWISSLIIAQANPTVFGSFENMEPLLSHCAETGINALWLSPISDKGGTGNGYSNLGAHTIDPYLTGILSEGEQWRQLTAAEYEEGWSRFGEFVDLAHSYNIRIFMDIVSWGTMNESPLVSEHPDWYLGTSQWGENDWDWDNPDLADWFVQTLTEIAVKTGIDGFRYDLEPNEAGYEVNARVKESCLAAGRKMVYFSENGNERGASYDFAQADIIGPDYISVQYFESVFLKYNIVDCIKNGRYIGTAYSQEIGDSGNYRYYSHMLSCHDAYSYGVLGNRLVIGYETLYAPFIPIWTIGEEFNNSKNGTSRNILYMNTLKLEELDDPEKRGFYEDVKKMIQIRRTYPDLFESFAESIRDSNICEVKVTGVEELQPYARFSGSHAVMIIPNYNIHDKDTDFKVYVPFADMELDYYSSYTVTDLITGEVVVSGNAAAVHSFTADVEFEDMGVYRIEAHGARQLPAAETEETLRDWFYDDSAAEENTAQSGGAQDDDSAQRRKRRVVRVVETMLNYIWYIIGGAAAALIAAGTVFLILFLKKRKRKMKGEGKI